MIHKTEHPLSGETVKIKPDHRFFPGEEYRVEDWWDRVSGKSWMFCEGNPACIDYAIRAASADLPIDNNVLYGKIGMFGKLIHVSEIEGDDE